MHQRPLAALLLAASLMLYAPSAWAAPPGKAGWIKRKIQDLRLPGRCRLARMQLKRSRVGVACGAVSRRVKQASMFARGHLTLAMDRIELNVSPSLARGIHVLRTFNPFSLTAFALRKFSKDPLFLTGYGAFSFGFSNLQTPALIALGVNPLAAVAVRIVTGTPMDLGILLWREHRKLRRIDPQATLAGTVRHVGQEYQQFVQQRRAENRRYIAGRRAAGDARGWRPGGPLRRLAAPLIQP